MLQKILLYTVLLFMCVNNNDLSAQILEGHLASQKIKNAKKIWLNEQNSSIKYIEFLVPEKVDKNDHSKWLCQLLNCPSNVEFRLIRKIDDQIGQTHYRYAQYIDNYLIEGTQYLVHKRNNQILSVNGDLHTAKELLSTASISEGQALSYAKKSVPSNNYLWEAEKAAPPEGTLVLVGKKGIYRLAYKFDIYSSNPLGRYYVFVDANSGEIVQKISRIHNVATPGIAHTKYSGIQTIITDSIGPGMYILKDSTRNIHTKDLNTSLILSTAVEFTDSNNVWTSTINQDDAALDAHWGTTMTYDYFLNMHGLDSYDGLGASLNSYVHYGVNVYNAFWDGSQMVYGDGNGPSTALTSIDIVAHEISHGVTEYSANLVYQDEPGALNESFSDIFGVAVDFYANPTTANWYMGDQISIPDNGERNLADPNEMQHPDTYQGNYWHIGTWDNGGVHTNSGVQNFWFYLLTRGGTGVNDIGNAYRVRGLGIVDAGKIAYRNLSVYLTPSSQYVDARFYAIQSASDLFGTCSMEEEETTNAWHAVGIGNIHPNSVRVSFNVSQMYSCSIPVTIDFNNTSINDSTTLWHFGDGDSSSLRNSSHTYTAAGIYDLTLIIAGSSSCGRGADTIFLPNYIRIDSSGGPIAAACAPVGTTGDMYYGIFNYTFNTINNSTGGSLDGYEDYSCSHQTRVTEGDFVNLSIETGPHYSENVAVYIDYNNDGIFRATERIYAHSGIRYHTATVRIATATAHNVPLRMRVISDSRALTSTCNGSLNRSQIEDYNIIIAPALTPPVANFVGNPVTTINMGNSVSFSDNSSGFPTSYLWSFPNGVPATSTIANPVVTYSILGRHDVQLIVTNTFGSDTLLRSNYISVIDTATMCSSSFSIGRSGVLYDSGGPLGEYSSDEDCYFLIEPLCVDSIILDFTRFGTQPCCDFIRVYDGTSSTSGILLYEARGNTLPPRAVATSGAMYIYFHTSRWTHNLGFEAHWSTVQSPLPPVVASFTASSLNPVFGSSVSFTDQTANNPSSWLWEFGDGNTSIAQNPTHTYLSSGPHTVNLITSICGIFDTTSQIINVQAPPILETNPDSVSIIMNCGDSMTVPIVISNTGNGPLHYTINSTHSLLPIDVVAWTYGVDYGAEYTNTINGLNNYYTNYTLRETNTTDPTTLQSFLSTAHVLLIPEQEMASFFVLQGMAPTLQNYVNNGGWIIVCGNQASSIHALGLFNLTAGNSVFTGAQTIVDTNSPLLVNTTAPIRNLNSTFYGAFSNIGFNTVTSYLGSSVIGDLDIGQGKAIYIGFDYSQNTPNRDQIIANAVEWAATNATPLWMTNSPNSGSVLAGDSVLVDAIINVNGIAGGIYNGNLVIESNDSINPILNIPINLTIAGTPSIAFSENCVLFDSTIQHTSDTAGVWVYNTGCDTLRITNITSSNANVSPNSSNLVLDPYDSVYVNFIFTPDTAQSYLGSITFFSNAGDSIICLDGTGILPPMMEINPDSIFVTINCEDSVVVPLIISNIGMGVLTYNDTIVDTWLALSSNSGAIPLGGSNTAYVTIYGAGRTDGVYTSSIIVSSNDPNAPTRIIPVILTIERNAILGVSDSCLNLGSVLQNIPAMDSVLVSNTGCEVMHITNINSSFGGLIGAVDTIMVPSGQSTWLQVNYTSNILGTFNANITIVTTNQDTSICVYGIVTTGSDVKQLETSEAIAKIYPNPNNGDFTFYYKGDSKSIHLNLYGVNGQLILSKEHQVTESLLVNFTDLNLSEGVYYLEMISDKETKTLELIVTEP